MVLLIGIAHGLPLLFVAYVFGSTKALNITTAVMAVIAIATGGQSYLIVDLLFIGIAYAIAMSLITGQKN